MQHRDRLAAKVVRDLHIRKAYSAGKPRAQRLDHRLLGSEVGGKVHGGVVLRAAVVALCLGEDLALERRAALEYGLHAGDLHDVHPQPGHRHGGRLPLAGLVLLLGICLFDAHCYSTVTDLARFLGWSTSQPRLRATLRASSCRGTLAVMAEKQSRTGGM